MSIPEAPPHARIERIDISKVVSPLRKPYVLSFVTLAEYPSLQATVTSDAGTTHTAEVVPLPGYSDETEASILDYLHHKQQAITGMPLADARQDIAADIAGQPFSTSPLLTAIDLFSWSRPRERELRPMVLPCATTTPQEVAEAAVQANAAGRTLKVKLSGKVDQDINGLLALADIEISQVRLDANQAYDFDDAVQLITHVTAHGIHSKLAYFEQPFDKADWESHERLNAAHPELPVMLDETVVTDADIARACQAGFTFLKLKLFKQGGIRETLRQATQAHAAGVHVIMGNGVATAMANDIENGLIQQHPELFWGDSEANGFMKLA